MIRTSGMAGRLAASGIGIMMIALAAGCNGGGAEKPVATSTTGTAATAEPGSAEEVHDHQPGPPLSAEDQALADRQKFCPVSDEELGSMGSPVKLMVKGEPVFICCQGCEKSVNADPDKYLAKVAAFKKQNSQEGGAQ